MEVHRTFLDLTVQNICMIDLRRVQVLRVVDEVGTVTAAARSLHLTPSAVSQQLRALARDVGVDLLVPDGRGVRLSPAAHALLRHADDIAVRWENAMAEVLDHADQPPGALAVGGIPSSLDMLVAPAVAELRRTQPRLLVRIGEVETADAFERVLAGDLDIAVFVPNRDSPPTDDPRFEQEALLDIPQDLLVPAGHPLAGVPDATLDRAAHEPWILPAPDSCDQYELALVACIQAGFRPTVAHEATEWAAVAALVGHGLGIALVPRLVRIPEGLNAVRVPLTDPAAPRRRLLTCIRRGSGRQRAIALGMTALAEQAARAVPEPVTT